MGFTKKFLVSGPWSDLCGSLREGYRRGFSRVHIGYNRRRFDVGQKMVRLGFIGGCTRKGKSLELAINLNNTCPIPLVKKLNRYRSIIK